MSIPTDEEFEKASAFMKQELHDAACVEQRLLPILMLLAPVQEVWVFKHTVEAWEVYSFVETEADLNVAVEHGFLSRGMASAKHAIGKDYGFPEDDVKLLFEVESREYASRKFGSMLNRIKNKGRAEYSVVCDGFWEAANQGLR